MISILPGLWSRFLNQVSQVISRWTKPVTTALIIGTVTDLTRSRTDLLIENALLRQQLIVLNRQVERPHFTPGDRWRLVLLQILGSDRSVGTTLSSSSIKAGRFPISR